MARSLLWRWLILALAIFFVPYLVPGVQVPGAGAALAMAAVLCLLNLLVKPLLVLMTLPLTVLTLGVFWLVINALLFEWAGYLVHGVVVNSFGDAFLASLIVSLVSWFLHLALNPSRRPKVRVWTSGRSSRRVPQQSKGVRSDTIELHESDSGKWE